jgi:flagellar capping protein FliD
MDGWVVETLKANGLAGVVIFLLVGAVVALWKMNSVKDRQLNRLHAERAAEREVLVRLVEGANLATMVTANATEKRNEIMDDLGKALTSQANAVERYDDRVKSQAEMLKDKFADFRHVVDSFGESNRVVSGLVADIRNSMIKLEAAINQLSLNVASALRST